MKAEIILAIVWMTLCVCERQQRSTVLTDESKRVLEHFDFSNFDKQEALNYIDRQRYENQIRGKRSHSKLKANQDGKNEKILDVETDLNELSTEKDWYTEGKSDLNSERIGKNKSDKEGGENNGQRSESSANDGTAPNEQATAAPLRNKRGHRSKIKRNRGCGRCRNAEKSADKLRKRKVKKKRKRHYWSHWNEWSPCSVTCGRGRKIRWRKCIAKNCHTGELEMGEKTCQLPACNLLTKILGL